MGLPLRELIFGEAYGQGVPGGRAVKAVSPGALSAPLLSAAELDVRLDTDALRAPPYRSQLGAGGIIVYDETVCAVELLHRTEQFFAHESCGKCVPCREGTRWMADLLDRVAGGRGRRRDLAVLGDVATNLVGMPAHQRTLCALGDFAAGPALAAPARFPADFEHHVREGRCPLARVPAAA
jgi:NADH-quinone oxidoreductase subunit F